MPQFRRSKVPGSNVVSSGVRLNAPSDSAKYNKSIELNDGRDERPMIHPFAMFRCSLRHRFLPRVVRPSYWLVGCVAQLAERRSLAGELTLSYARPLADG